MNDMFPLFLLFVGVVAVVGFGLHLLKVRQYRKRQSERSATLRAEEYAERKRQEEYRAKLDRQNNVGRHIRNWLQQHIEQLGYHVTWIEDSDGLYSVFVGFADEHPQAAMMHGDAFMQITVDYVNGHNHGLPLYIATRPRGIAFYMPGGEEVYVIKLLSFVFHDLAEMSTRTQLVKVV